jgi:agmatinase
MRRAFDYVLDRALQEMNCELLYLSIDLDALEPLIRAGSWQSRAVRAHCLGYEESDRARSARAVGLDINELTPAYDRGETALLVARLAREFIAARAKREI